MSTITYKESRRSRSVRITVSAGGHVRVTYPHRLPLSRVYAWVNERGEWILNAQRKMIRRGGIALPRGVEGRQMHAARTKEARVLVEKLLAPYAHIFSWKQVRITNAKTRWGSCSTRGTLSFNWRIILIPPELQEYLIVHELCHLKHHNHSANFWHCVSEYVPSYQKHKKALKQYHF